MPVVSSSYTIDAHTQANGGHYVMESHTDNTGRVHSYHYELPAGQGATEVEAMMAARVARIDAQLAEAEFEGIVDNGS
jgi:hypothetical protein